MKFVIDRNQWLRGNGVESSLRRIDDGKMCCLGFYGLACGIPVDEIVDHGDPSDTEGDTLTKWPEWLLQELPPDEGQWYSTWENTTACGDLIEANDSKEIEDPERERKIAAIFAEHGIAVEFVDGEKSDG